jgi:hypothetical protein
LRLKNILKQSLAIFRPRKINSGHYFEAVFCFTQSRQGAKAQGVFFAALRLCGFAALRETKHRIKNAGIQ